MTEEIQHKRVDWDQYFLSQALILSLRSTCERLMVGAVIVRDKRIIAGGYNGSVSGEDHCVDVGCYMDDGHCVRTIHAEMNAILQCARFGVSTDNSEIYVTHRPCLPCTKSLIQAGVKKITFLYDYRPHPYALELTQKFNIEVKQAELPDAFFSQFEHQHELNLKKQQEN